MSSLLVFVAEPVMGSCQDVMFLLDTSQSMNDSDPQRTAPDSIRAMTAALEPADRAGVIVFNTEARQFRPLVSPWEKGLPDFSGTVYDGYTNTGDAIAMALNNLEAGGAAKKAIVLVTDGEIMLPDADETLHSAQLFAESMERASRSGIPVYILSILNGPDDRDYKLYTGYAKGATVPDGQLLAKSGQLARESLGAYGMELSPTLGTNGAGRITSVTAPLPVHGAKHVRVVISASMAGTAATDGERTQGAQRVLAFNNVKLSSGRLEFVTDYPPGTELKLYAVPELDGKLLAKTELAFWGKEGKVRITPVSPSGDDKKLFDDAYFNGKKLHLKVNGRETEGTLENGTITAPLPDVLEDGSDGFVTVSDVRFEEIGVSFTGTNSARVPVERGGDGYVPWLFLGIALIILLLFLNYRKTKELRHRPFGELQPGSEDRPSLPEPVILEEKPVPRVRYNPADLSYCGKLVLYITRAPDDSDIPPLEFNLARYDRGMEITMAEVLKRCGLGLSFQGAEHVIIGPMARGIYVRNDSDCTVTKRGNIILKGESTDIESDGRVHIAFSDEISEMIMVYMDLKPSER